MDTILIIEDDPTLNKNITEALTSEKYLCDSVFDGLMAERQLQKKTYSCIIMDLNIPGKNGYILCQEFRKHNVATPILMLTAFDDLDDKVKGFESGADDYLTKPFFMRELLMRINVLIKRSQQSNTSDNKQTQIIAGDIVIDTLKKNVSRQGKDIILTPREYQILKRLCEEPSEIISKEEFIKQLWGTTFNSNTNTIEVYINFLRNKVDKPFGKHSIKTKVGYGYYLDTSDLDYSS